MPAVGLDFLLPTYIDLPNAYQAVVTPPNGAPGQFVTHVVPGEYFEIFAHVSFVLQTSATAGTRTPGISAQDANGKEYAALLSQQQQLPSVSQQYVFTLAVSAAYTPGNTSGVMPIFPFVFPAGHRFVIYVNNIQAADFLRDIGLVIRRYWTGPVFEDVTSQVETPTPLDTTTIETAPPSSGGEPAPAPTTTTTTTSAPAPSSAPRATTPGVDIGHATTPAPPPVAPEGTRVPD